MSGTTPDIERLTAEIEKLHADVAFMQSEARAWHERYDKAQAEVERLRRRVAELDAAVGQAWREP
jgi:predicted nuclease with TOPRIM domain